MPPISKESQTTATVAVATAVVSAAATYALTKMAEDRRVQKLRQSAYEEQTKIRASLAAAQKARGEPVGTCVPEIDMDQVYLWEVENLGARFDSESKGVENRMAASALPAKRGSVPPDFFRTVSSSSGFQEPVRETDYNHLLGTKDCILADIVRKPGDGKGSTTKAYVRAGPRKALHFDPKKVNAAIVTCGGLCPGLNNVVREITNSLYQLYGIEGTVFGIRGGYKGFYDPDLKPIKLTPEIVENIHHEGGTVLCSSRGGFDLEKIIAFIEKHDIKQLYVIGGDGTHRGAFAVHEGCMEKGMNVAVAGIPKTIDNDVDYIDRSFGFASAVEAAQAAIRSAKTEATCNLPNGVGIVKLMGRSAGFIALHATMASGDVDLCLVPEVPIVLEGEHGCLPHLMRRVKQQGYAVVVVAEGAGEEILGTSAETDASGNKILPKIGEFLKDKVTDYFKQQGDVATVKYIDPSYMVRSIPANSSDSLYCMQLAQNAVHGAMAGFTGFSVGLCNNRMVLLPIPELVATSPRKMNAHGRTWERVLAVTRQPNTVPPLKEGEVDTYDSHAPMLR